MDENLPENTKRLENIVSEFKPAQQIEEGQFFSKPLPQALDAERGVLCALLIDPNAFESVELEELQVEDFYHPAHALIFSEMMRLRKNQKGIDTISLSDALRSSQKLEEIGGLEMILGLETMLPAAAHVQTHAKLIQEKAMLRRVIAAANKAMQNAYRQSHHVEDIVDAAEREILQIRDQSSKKGLTSLAELALQVRVRLEDIYAKKLSLLGISTGFYDLDRFINGLQGGELIVVAARPSMGKTAFTLNIAFNVAVTKIPTVFFSLEMGAEQLVTRLIAARSEVNVSRISRGEILRDDFSLLFKVTQEIVDVPLYIDESPALSISEMRNKCRRMVKRHGVKVIIVDYLQFIISPKNY